MAALLDRINAYIIDFQAQLYKVKVDDNVEI